MAKKKKTAQEKALENIKDDIKSAHTKYKDHEAVEAAEVWWKKKSNHGKAVVVIIVLAVLFGVFGS